MPSTRGEQTFMKAIFLSLLLFLPIITNAQVVRIPDPNFKQRLIALGYDLNDDGKIQVSEAQKVTDLKVENLGIVNLEGINSFTNLEEFSCHSNKISVLDVSKLKKLTGLYCYDNPLERLNVAGLSQLKNLYIHTINNPISFIKILDVSTLTNLKDLRCSNNLITKLDVSGLDKLERIECENNRLDTVSLRKAPNLKYVNLENNPLQVTVDIRGLTNLEYFNCQECQLIFLNMSGTIKLKDLYW
jgi:protein phosphatase 1 regulatory subunit 7